MLGVYLKVTDYREYKNCLSHLAFDPKKSRGRRHPSSEDDNIFSLTDPFVSDKRRIQDSKGGRRLANKTQVFPNPDNPHIRTRLAHTLEVASMAQVAANIMGLNSNLCEAVAFGHDIGHSVYGHLGETVISELIGRPFDHSVFSVIVAQQIERKGSGLNLSFETLQGILNHSGKRQSNFLELPMESELVRLCDKIAYTFADLQDFRRMGLEEAKLPQLLWEFGADHRSQVATCIEAMVIESAEVGFVSFEKSAVAQKFQELKQWPYDNFYHKFDMDIPTRILKRISAFLEQYFWYDGPLLLALLTDIEAYKFAELFLKHPDNLGIEPYDVQSLRLGIDEIVPHIKGRDINMTDPDLNWAS